jgi:pimeloyl-ACP methyl ester carboxylesterase
VRAQALKLLAHGLAREGVPSVRVDKRGMFGSAARGLDANTATLPLYAADVLAWVEIARAEGGSPCAWLLGHSEGALVAALAAQNAPASVCGVISVSGAGRKFGDVIREQLTSNPANAPVLDQALRALAELEAGRDVDVTGMHPALLSLFAPQIQGYLKSLLSQDPAALLGAAQGPVLIVNGDADLQTTVADARALAAARPDATLVIWPGVNHVLKAVPADRAANVATYADPDLPLAPGVVDVIASFVRR